MPEPTEFPVRPHGEAWPGLKSKRGRIGKAGELSDCRNVEILTDLLMKRKGFVRGIEEWFDLPVCGLFTYTDLCQNEYLLVATSAGIAIRTPFAPVTFQIADCYPFDEFAGSGFASLNSDKWKLVSSRLGIDENSVGLKSTAQSLSAFDVEAVIDNYTASWFKLACQASYQIQLNLDLPDSGFEPHVAGIIRGGEVGFQNGAFLMGDFFRRQNQTFGRIMHVTGARAITEVATIGPFTDGNGVGTIAYDLNTQTATISFLPDVGTASASSSSHKFNGLQDAEFGLATGFSIFFLSAVNGQARPSALAPPAFGLDDVEGASS